MAKLSKETQAIIEALRVQPHPETVSAKSINVIVMAVICAVGTLVWDNVTSKTPETFSTIQQTTAEIRSTVFELRSTVTEIKTQLDRNQRQTADQQARISALEAAVGANSKAIEKLTDERSR